MSIPNTTPGSCERRPNSIMPGAWPGMTSDPYGRWLVRRLAVDHVLELAILLAARVATDQLDFLQVVERLEPIALLHVPHAVVGPGANMVWIGLEGSLIPDLGLVVVAHLAVCVADIIGDIGVIITAERMHGGNAGLVLAVKNELAGCPVVAQEFLLGQLLFLLLNDTLVLFLLFLLAVVGGRRTIGAHCEHCHGFDADGGHEQGSGSEHTGATKNLDQGHGGSSPAKGRLTKAADRTKTICYWSLVPATEE